MGFAAQWCEDAGPRAPAMLRVCARGRVLWRELPLPLKDCVLTLRVLCACVTLSLLAAVLNRASVRLTLKRGRRTLQVLNHFWILLTILPDPCTLTAVAPNLQVGMARAGPGDAQEAGMTPHSDSSDSETDEFAPDYEGGGTSPRDTSAGDGDGQFDNYLRVNMPALREKPVAKSAPTQVPPALMDVVLGTLTAVSAPSLDTAADLPPESDDVPRACGSCGEDKALRPTECLRLDTMADNDGRARQGLGVPGQLGVVGDACEGGEAGSSQTVLSTESADAMEREWSLLQVQRQAAEAAVHMSVVHAAARTAPAVPAADSRERGTACEWRDKDEREMPKETDERRGAVQMEVMAEDDFEQEWLKLMSSRIAPVASEDRQSNALAKPTESIQTQEDDGIVNDERDRSLKPPADFGKQTVANSAESPPRLGVEAEARQAKSNLETAGRDRGGADTRKSEVVKGCSGKSQVIKASESIAGVLIILGCDFDAVHRPGCRAHCAILCLNAYMRC